jgi:uncharacterized coiled-coil DUF342 family protein
MEQMQDERQRVDRWLEESQYLIGRLIPAYLEDRDRVRTRMESADQECDRLRQEVGELRRELGILQAEVQYYRGEHQAAQCTARGAADGRMDHASRCRRKSRTSPINATANPWPRRKARCAWLCRRRINRFAG